MSTENINKPKARYYRNSKLMHTKQGGEIETGSLWKEKDGELVLVDDDQYASSPITEDFVLISK